MSDLLPLCGYRARASTCVADALALAAASPPDAGVTEFPVRLARGRKVLADLNPGRPGVLTTDRYLAHAHLPVDQRQVCWAHLRRNFQVMIARRNTGSSVGEDLLHADLLLTQWK